MSFLQEKDRTYIKKIFTDLHNEVKIYNFTQEMECQYCRETRQILEEVAEISDKINLRIFDFVKDKAAADKFNIDKIPATVVSGSEDFGVRYYGIPSGYEFSSLLQTIVDVANGESGLSRQSRKLLNTLKTPLHLQVFVTPTCPYCPAAVQLAHKMAIESKFVRSDMVEATEFPHLAMKYNVRGVPRTIINEEMPVEGALQEEVFIQKILDVFNQNNKHN